MNIIDLYKVKWDSEEDGLLYGVSIVDKPANMFETIELSKHEHIDLKVQDEKKKQLAGVVLIPNQKIRRYTDEKGEFDVIFEADTIEKLSHEVFKKNYHQNTWYNHDREQKVEGSTIVESWIITDENKDKAFAMGFKDLPVGTWMCIMQLSDEAWDEYIKTGKAKGFSIDSLMSLEKIEYKEDNNNNNVNTKIEMDMSKFAKSFLNLLKDEAKKEEVKMIEIPMGEDSMSLMADSLEMGSMVMQGDEPAKEVEFTFEGMEYKTNAEGMISEIEAVKSESEDELPEMELSEEEDKKMLFDMIEKNPELVEVLKERYKSDEAESINMSLEKAKTDEDVKSKFKNLFLEEINAKAEELKSKDAEIAELKAKLDETPSNGKLKAQVNLKKEDKPTGTLGSLKSVIERNKQK